MNNIELANSAFDAAEARDQDKFRSHFTADARIWHNFTGADEPAGDAISNMFAMTRAMVTVKYEDRRYVALPDGAVLQHLSRSTLPDGRELAVPMMMRLYSRDSKICRIEEYLDTQAFAALMHG
jgi:ketosteroid isomerase-like protein